MAPPLLPDASQRGRIANALTVQPAVLDMPVWIYPIPESLFPFLLPKHFPRYSPMAMGTSLRLGIGVLSGTYHSLSGYITSFSLRMGDFQNTLALLTWRLTCKFANQVPYI
eukprot:GHVR01080164.1.p1 GENE.GHVR01080164.1~~GHVR01080164.1.p1  ORF type:complete len:111 (+),score=2.47 GHVR01080164.1:61-393(+)